MSRKKIGLKTKIGIMLRGQAWVELKGIFYAEELHSIANQIDENCKGLKRNGDKK